MKHPNKSSGLPAIGGSSLLITFAVLCLTVFALLGLGTVNAEKRLADISLQAITDYYAADCEAEAIFAQIRADQIPDCVVEKDGRYCYSCPISSTQALCVEIRCEDSAVLRWQTVSTADWKENEELELWDGSR